MTPDTPSARAALGRDGVLARHIDGFAPRAEQQDMADAVAHALEEHETLLVEAGTGVGKTFAYLVPALLCGGKVIVSTGTKNLQDQLFQKDLPVVRKALGSAARVALLKGRANYLCVHRMDTLVREGRLPDRRQVEDLRRIREWAAHTRTGDIAEVDAVPEGAELWPRVTSTVDNCLGTECPEFQNCHVVKARRQAQEADVVVINHHLFLADLALKEEGFGELLPAANAVILDEAHQLPEIASSFFGLNLSSRQLLDLSRDTVAEGLKEAPDMGGMRESAAALEQAVQVMRLALGRPGQRDAWARIRHKPAVAEALDALEHALGDMDEQLELAAERGQGLEACARRAGLARARLERLRNPSGEMVLWYETYARAFSLNITPLDVAQVFHSRLEAHRCAWVLTSATLAVGDSFAHFSERLGLGDAQSLCLDSPFDYEQNALLYHPPGLPDPNDPAYTREVVEAALPVIEASGGRAFLLFTSHRALQEAATLLDGRCTYPLLVQGGGSRRQMIERFRELGNAVLLGTASFWEGVDVRGEALSCVIIDRLPFAAPNDPVLQARMENIRRQGGNPFMDYQLPQAVITLKQGVGRLIRDVTDRGVLVLCDPRLHSKPYGRLFLESLPTMPRSRDLRDVQAFFAEPPLLDEECSV